MSPGADSQEGRFALSDLEFQQVRRLLVARTRTPLGAEEASRLAPSPVLSEVQQRLDLLREGLYLASQGTRMGFPDLDDPGPDLDRLQAEGVVLEVEGLRNLSALAMSVAELSRDITPHRQEVPLLLHLLQSVTDLAPFARACRGVFAADGGIEDGASAHLRSLRSRMNSAGERLRRRMAAYLDGPEAERYLRDEYVTRRNGRFVLPVRSEQRKAVGGIVHGTSSSGVTLYVEPLAMVDLNNDLIRLQEEEKAEVARILAELSALARQMRSGFQTAAAVVGRLDLLAASVRLALDYDAGPATLATSGGLEMRQARHLLLAARLAESGEDIVPISVKLEGDNRVLVVSGPNTGGKTVALKTLGLSVLLTQSGLAVPADSARLPVFRQVLADIGDHQSIDEDLSTFSSHIRSLIRMTGEIEDPALVLVDELGTGTDPDEGAALGIAVVENFRRRGGFVMVTTHHNGLKEYAETTPGVTNASVEFDEESLRPTFRLLSGVAGRSGGLDIAARLGLPAAIVEHARSLISERQQTTQKYLSRLAELTAAAADARNQAEEERRLAAEEKAAASTWRLRMEKKQKQQVEAAVDAARRNMEKAGRQALESIEKEFGRGLRRRAEEKARSEYARMARREVLQAGRHEEPGASDPAGAPVAAGDRVRIDGVGHEGVVEQVAADGRLTVMVGHARLVSHRDQVQKVSDGTASRRKTPEGQGRIQVRSAAEEDSLPMELHLRGLLVADGLAELDRYLDRALLSGTAEVRVIHGHGTGRLKKAVREHLRGHQAVASFRPGGSSEGGDGATVVRLAIN